MEPLHAPWRIAYIRGPKPAAGTAHLFQEIAESSDDEANYVVVRDRTCYALLNRFPYTGGHLLVVPYKLSPDLDGLTDDEMCDLFKLTRRCQHALTAVMRPEGFNIGINLGRVAGAGIIDHVHVHIVPRWTGDTNFMPVLGSTTVLPEALSEMAAQLRTELARQPA
jgi:ATP adenylyltransferase